MNYVLLLIILGMAGGGYYEYSEAQKSKAMVAEQAADLGGKIDNLQADNKKLEDDKANLAKSLEAAQTQIADLSGQVQTAQKALEDANKKAEQAELAMHPPAPAAAQPPSINLGTIQTLDGKTFQNCQLLKVEADGITINHSSGITKILFGLLPAELQKQYGYDPQKATALTEAQIRFQEDMRKAAATTGK